MKMREHVIWLHLLARCGHEGKELVASKRDFDASVLSSLASSILLCQISSGEDSLKVRTRLPAGFDVVATAARARSSETPAACAATATLAVSP